MDFMTSLPYWGILIIIAVNAIIVWRMDVTLDDDADG
tara:strand:- start:637 stop:747 length:111 start_codon:yes stop_codon:yes gene_type:complete